MAETYDLSREIGISEMSLSSGGITEGEESLLILGNKPESLANKEIHLRYSDDRDWSSSQPEAFFAEAGVFNERELKSSWSQLAKDGWSFKVRSDPDGNKTSKGYYVRIENSSSPQVYIGVPIPKNHFSAGQDPILDDLLIIDEQSFIDNPNFAIGLNHQKINVENNNGRWTVAKNDILAGRIKLPGNTVEANNPEELYLLTEAELKEYNSNGKRKGWREEPAKRNDLRSFVKEEDKSGQKQTLDRRFAREIMIPQMVNGEETPVKHFLLSDQKTLESIEIMDPKLQEEESITQGNAEDTAPDQPIIPSKEMQMGESSVFFNNSDGPAMEEELFESQAEAAVQDEEVIQAEAAVQDEAVVQGEAEVPGYPSDRDDPRDYSEIETHFESENPSASMNSSAAEISSVTKTSSKSGKPKVELTGMAKELARQIALENNGTLSLLEKEFLDELNMVQDDPQKLNEVLRSIERSPDHANIMRLLRAGTGDSKQNTSSSPEQSGSGTNETPSTSVGGAEAAFGAAAGLGVGVVKGAAGLVGTAIKGAAGLVGATASLGGAIAQGTLTEVKSIIQNHQKRKQYRLDHPEVVEEERAASKARLMATRQAVAEDSNRILDAKIASVLGSKQYIDQNPAVQQMYEMIDDNPAYKDNLEGWLEDTAASNPVFAEHLKNVKDNAGDVARSMEENLKLNSLADGDLQERKSKFDNFNDNFANDSLADALSDAGLKTPDGEQAATIRESITKAINNIMKMLKDMMLRLLGKNKDAQGESVGQSDDPAPAMSR